MGACAMTRYSKVMRDRARGLRQNPTEVETRLWSQLRDKQLDDRKFRRQQPIGRYVVDFLCEPEKLIIELDGGQHADDPRDTERTAFLEAQGYRVIRYWNNEVIENIDGVLSDIRSKLRAPHPGPPPGGEGVPAANGPTKLTYERDPAAIYAASFATVRAEANLGRLPESLRPVAVRLIHSCGMVDIADDLAFSDDVADAGAGALAGGAPILCDCEMVASGIIRARLPAENQVIVTLNDSRVAMLAAKLKTTRSAAAVVLWREHLEGAVVAIGNAPTALFNLLERLDTGWPKPAAILGFPVGFVGATESKAELAANARGVPFLTLQGRRGGSAIASAAVNALARDDT